MTDLLLIAVAAATVNNFVLVRLLGLCPLLGAGSRLEDVPGIALATTGVLTVTAGLCHALDRWVLVPFGLPYLRIVGFLALTLLAVRLANLVLPRPGHQLPPITTNCAVLGVALLNVQQQHGLLQSALYGFGAATGFGLVLILFAAARERLAFADVPAHFRGAPIGLVTAGLMALAFMGFSGLADL